MSSPKEPALLFLQPVKISNGSYLLLFSLGIAWASPGLAQTAPTVVLRESRGPGITPIAAAELSGANSSYIFSESNGWTCPTPSISIGGFGSGGNDWANDYTSYASAGSGISNFGAGVGLSIPLGGQYGKNCNDYAKSLAAKARAQSDQAQRNNQLILLDQCYWLLRNRINLDQPAFADGGAFSSLQPCKAYSVKMAQGGGNPLGLDKDPPLSNIPAPPPSNLSLRDR